MLLMQAGGAAAFGVHYLLIGANTAALLLLVAGLQALAAIPLGTRAGFRLVYLATIPAIAVIMAFALCLTGTGHDQSRTVSDTNHSLPSTLGGVRAFLDSAQCLGLVRAGAFFRCAIHDVRAVDAAGYHERGTRHSWPAFDDFFGSCLY